MSGDRVTVLSSSEDNVPKALLPDDVARRETVPANPYRSPRPWHDGTESPPAIETERALTAAEARLGGVAVRIILCGLVPGWLLAAGSIGLGVTRYGGAIGAGLSQSGLGSFVPIAALCSVLIIVGVVVGNRVRGKHRSLGRLTVLMSAIGVGGVYGVCQRVAAGEPLLGLAPLFAASSFSAWLTSLALLAIFLRVWSLRCRATRLTLLLELQVLLFAVAGVCVSAAALWPGFSRTATGTLALAGIGLATLTSGSLVLALVLLDRTLRRVAGPPVHDVAGED
ncbi:hypothetical protein FYK55_01620 [Roseiconus nitratireducens]|uniref:Uncharacterized protein n=1 Tax=Roseiconus nitratireducens TaxID=2605748 RepID=A0A5M6DLY6_9BACT|nr:hypothetical protein [Roseiconus nitratireducens]KAA5547140.1 hypothetical protein FYK55_01620 [Roseiconus nitratireducens]